MLYTSKFQPCLNKISTIKEIQIKRLKILIQKDYTHVYYESNLAAKFVIFKVFQIHKIVMLFLRRVDIRRPK